MLPLTRPPDLSVMQTLLALEPMAANRRAHRTRLAPNDASLLAWNPNDKTTAS